MGGHGNYGHQPQTRATDIGNIPENEARVTNHYDVDNEGSAEDNSNYDYYDYGDSEQTNHDTTVILIAVIASSAISVILVLGMLYSDSYFRAPTGWEIFCKTFQLYFLK